MFFIIVKIHNFAAELIYKQNMKKVFVLLLFCLWMIKKNKQIEVNTAKCINELNKKIEFLLSKLKEQSEKIKVLEILETSDTSQGRLLFEQINNNKSIINWTAREEEIFIFYMELTNYDMMSRIKKIQRREKITNHRMLYLILKELRKTDQEVCTIMMLSPEGLRTMRNRTKPV